MKEQILIIDDNKDILELLEYNLSSAGYEVIGFLNTKNVRKVILEESINLIIIDRCLPDIEGSLYIEMLRNENINIPVIFLSAKGSLQDIKDGLTRGADDYITKPFDMEELLLRVKAVLKRYKKESLSGTDTMEHRDIKFYLNLHTVFIESAEIALTKREAALLKIFIVNKNHVLDRDFLLKNIWHDIDNIHPKTVNVAISRLKEKIDPNGVKEYIKTIRGIGYLLT